MGKRRNRKRNRQPRNRLLQFRAQSLVQSVQDEAGQEEYKTNHKKFLQEIADIEKDYLSRTVFVGSVKSLNDPTNLKLLKSFLEENYGRVEICERRFKRGERYPRGRVRFYDRKDAEKIFGMPLIEALKQNKATSAVCFTVGYVPRRRSHPCMNEEPKITIRPSSKYPGMVENELENSKLISINTELLSFGHWFPMGKDECMNMPGLETIGRTDKHLWVEEEKNTQVNPIVSFDFMKSVVELDMTHCEATDPSIDPSFGILLATMLSSLKRDEKKFASFRFKDLAHPMELCRCDQDQYYLIFSLKHPPRLCSTWTETNGWEKRERHTSIAGLGEEAFGSCLGYKLRISSTEMNRLLLNRKGVEKLHNFGILRDGVDSMQQAEAFQVELANETQRIAFNGLLESMGNSKVGLLVRSILDNQSCCWLHMFEDRATTDDNRLQGFCDLVCQGSPNTVANVLTQMKDSHGKTIYPAHMFLALHGAAVEEDETEPRSIPQFCIDLPRLIITPTRVCVAGFQQEVSNRLVRKFLQEYSFAPESFVRVSIGDENSDKLFSDDLQAGSLSTRIKTLLLKGIKINGATYRFLAYSSSQLKELSVWMVCPEDGWYAEAMRDSMGDFSMCKTPSKYAARIGQCFSTTVETRGHTGIGGDRTSNLRVKDDLDDINTFNSATGEWMEHSDGAGIIRKDVLAALVSTFPFGPKEPSHVSVIQIRLGGAKGVLVGWDFKTLPGGVNFPHRDLHPGVKQFQSSDLQNCDVFLRRSMVKFKALYDTLEVVSIGSHVPYYLNRNVILILSRQGISDRTILGLQAEMLEKLNRMLTDRQFACSFIRSLSGPDSSLVSTLVQMLGAGLEPNEDPFLFSCLHATRAHHLMGLRRKARIHVDKGAVLIGAIDELGLVPEGCIFCQVRMPRAESTNEDEEDGDGFQPVLGPVLVTKHPVMHPGDLRMLLGVDIPQLRGHKNVVLFSQHGERPEANKMSGSDLDGDQFALTWDERLFLSSTADPMDYTPSTKAPEAKAINNASLIDHFIDHARADNVGRIAMLWLDHAADKKDAGCEECLELANLHSISVDFPKSGIPAVVPNNLKFPSTHPRAHWREFKGGISFHCDSIVGKLYDQIIDEIRRTANSFTRAGYETAGAGRFRDKNGQILFLVDPTGIIKCKQEIYNPSVPRRLGWSLNDGLSNKLLAFANEQRHEFERQLIGLMNQYRIECEGEIATGCILKYHKLYQRRRHDVTEEVRRQFGLLRREFRNEFFRAANKMLNNKFNEYLSGVVDDEDDEPRDEDLQWIQDAATTASDTSVPCGNAKVEAARDCSRKLAAAYYMATYSPEMHNVDVRSALFSFPWVVVGDVITKGLTKNSGAS
ncbi:RNA-dependent RNA polymerase 1 [Seminavis robusta]|uniref:RNA-dependent RNA polymerase n=1 Tax=Seminavis robusta TaxID=568900 RepID=A0A9N8EAG4_9STRA|nr:RNA-dependent RNA polymerase 1 [Seminavis robusta]|eukprot:Sro728_g193730.1 RNA-dependent RNA polymerase 1 (1359) ;mRNA; f:29625-33783